MRHIMRYQKEKEKEKEEGRGSGRGRGGERGGEWEWEGDGEDVRVFILLIFTYRCCITRCVTPCIMCRGIRPIYYILPSLLTTDQLALSSCRRGRRRRETEEICR